MKVIKAMLLGAALVLGAATGSATWAAASEPAVQAQPTVNINQANAAELAEALQGIGISRANAIVAWRQAHGPFKSVDDLANVKGIGAATIKRNKSRILLK
ncbi:MAG: helix-hairpin-helix domain-containing protein [Alcanivoracaceae bacterium]|nr:helix-hairpin-helix domain-containing protein [Alcanivoracaceae bacterium]